MTDRVVPSRAIPLGQDQLAELGELTATIALIDEHMIDAIATALGVSAKLSAQVLGSNNFTQNADLWAAIIAEKSPNAALRNLCFDIAKRARRLGASRNSYVHAVFIESADIPESQQTPLRNGQRITSWSVRQPPGHSFDSSNPVSVVNARKDNSGDAVGIRTIRDDAAHLSHEFAHISAVLRTPDHDLDAPSPWRETVRSDPHR